MLSDSHIEQNNPKDMEIVYCLYLLQWIYLKPKNISMSYLFAFSHVCEQGACIICIFFFFFGNKCSRNRNFVPWLTPQNSVLLPTSLFFWREGREIIPEKRIILALEQLNIRDEIQNKCYTASWKFNCFWGLETCLIVSRILHSLILRGSQINILLIACL